MTRSTTISITEARKRIFEIADKVQYPNIIYTLTEKGTPKVVMMSAEEFASWMETLEVYYDLPGLEKDIAKFEQDLKSGKYKKYPTLEEVMTKKRRKKR